MSAGKIVEIAGLTTSIQGALHRVQGRLLTNQPAQFPLETARAVVRRGAAPNPALRGRHQREASSRTKTG